MKKRTRPLFTTPLRSSLDNALDWWQPNPGLAGLLIALIAGGGAAAALLAAFWRPVKKTG